MTAAPPITAQMTPAYSRKNPLLAPLVRHEMLTAPGSSKDTRHFVFDLAGSGLTYTPGDSLAVIARNAPTLVEELLTLLGFEAAALVKDAKGQTIPFRQALSESYILNRASKKIMAGLAERLPEGGQRTKLAELTAQPEALTDYLHTHDYVDVLRDFTEAKFATPEDFLSQLSPIPPRLYSIASSPAAHPGEVHLCIAIVRYETNGRKKTGLCSGFLADHAEMHTKTIPIYVQESRHFRLPKEGATDIIMVGPGTGIAPFRAFIEQRAHDGSTGRNWLFFGEQHRATDFLYGAEFLEFQKQGKLHRLDLAFSRDGASKTYVQHRLRERGRDVFAWLENGAHLYVCGDATRMARDVHAALLSIIATHGGKDEDGAADYLSELQRQGRYARDVY